MSALQLVFAGGIYIHQKSSLVKKRLELQCLLRRPG